MIPDLIRVFAYGRGEAINTKTDIYVWSEELMRKADELKPWKDIALVGTEGQGVGPPRTPNKASLLTLPQSGSLGEGVLGLSSSDLLLGAGLVKFHELGQIELGLLQHLDLLDEDVFKGEDLRALLGDLLGNGVGQAAVIYQLLTR